MSYNAYENARQEGFLSGIRLAKAEQDLLAAKNDFKSPLDLKSSFRSLCGCRHCNSKQEGKDCTISFAKAMHDAGGSIPTIEDLEKMTIKDFICKIAAQNHIRFIYDK